MRHLYTQLVQDEAGFIVSAELILISTILIVALVVGLSEVASAVNHELNDVASAFGSVNQSFRTGGHRSGGRQNGRIERTDPDPES